MTEETVTLTTGSLTKEILAEGWSIFIRHLPLLMFVFLIARAITLAGSLLFETLFSMSLFGVLINIVLGTGTSTSTYSAPSIFNTFTVTAMIAMSVFVLLYIIIQVFIKSGLISICLNVVKKQESNFVELFSGVRHVFNLIIGGIVYLIIVIIGLILLIIPGVVWAIKFQFFPYVVVDKNIGPLYALKESARLTKGAKMSLFLVDILFAVINVGAGCLFMGIPLIVTAPITMVTLVLFYKRLENLNFQPTEV